MKFHTVLVCLPVLLLYATLTTCQRQRRARINDEGVLIRTTDENSEQIEKRFLDQPDDLGTWSAWGAEGPCSTSCGRSGFKERLRTCSTGNNNDCSTNGSRYWEVLICDNGACGPTWSEWSSPSVCSVSCGVGILPKLRNCSTGVLADCPGRNWEVELCDQGSCTPITTTPLPTASPFAVWSSWQAFESCNAQCGGGFRKRQRTCSSGRARDCPGLPYQITVCNTQPCGADGEWSVWTSWSSCSASCGTGNITRSRTCDFPADTARGKDCVGASLELLDCDAGLCPADGVWSNWGGWATCSRSCDSGFRIRTRNCTYPENVPRGSDCIGSAAESDICQTDPCPVDGVWATWSQWSNCSQECGGGTRFRARSCNYTPGHPRGKPCEGNVTEQESCNTDACAVDGKFTSWSSWTQCSSSCDGGLQRRQRVCSYPSNVPRGKPCNGNTTEFRDCALDACPVDGVWQSWGSWGSCTTTCGSGIIFRNRTCAFPSTTAPRGQNCTGHGLESKPCSNNLCPVDGQWTAWGRFLPCTKSCGGGDRVRVRTCQYSSIAPRGNPCPNRSLDVKPCNQNACPVDGSFDLWSTWSICTKSCEGGDQTRTRNCVFPDKVPHGTDCVGDRNETQTCNSLPCPTTTPATTTTTEATADGHWADWEAWTSCSRTCGTGIRERARQCTYPDHTLHGKYCPGDKNQTQNCNTDHCPVDGSWSNWQSWSKCSVTCANGTQTRARQCDFDPRYPKGSNCSGIDTETKSCDQGQCPVDGQWSSWLTWSSCSVTCEDGTQKRLRTCDFPPNSTHGRDCAGDNHEDKNCSKGACPVDGTLTSWTIWSNCSVTCGSGTQIRTRQCSFPPNVPRGNNCTGSLTNAKPCNTNLCPIDGHWGNWSNYETCSRTCGSGTQSRFRTCLYDFVAPHGVACPGVNSQRQTCNSNACPVDGHWSSWASWSLCSVSCGNGTRTRNHTCEFVKNKPRGANCTGADDETQTCNDGPCPVDGTWSAWTSWTTCTVTCGNGTSSRSRNCTFQAGVPQGQNCTGDDLETKSCNTKLCPIDGVLSEWGSWSACSLTCGTGIRRRERNCTFDALAPRGSDCAGSKADAQNCNTDKCPVDGIWVSWSTWSQCSATCGSGTQFRTRKCLFIPSGAPHGKNCTGLGSDQQTCNTNACPVDGQWTNWEQWSSCSKSCNNGTRSRTRRCTFPPGALQGANCNGTEKEAEPCNVDLCSVDGHWSEWSNYSACSQTCGSGTHVRNRTCIWHDPNPHGSICYGATNESDSCNTTPCPECINRGHQKAKRSVCALDGSWSEWGNWTSCSKSCGGGIQIRARVCSYPPGATKGDNCTGNSTQQRDCSQTQCPVDGVLSRWTPWSNCSLTCGNGTAFRIRSCDFIPALAPKGKNCTGPLQESKICNNGSCPVDGVWAQWGNWNTCNVTCGGGYQQRQRNCSYQDDAPRGDPCPGNDTAERSCNTDLCAVDGVWGSWSKFSSCSKSCGNGTSTRNRSCEYSPTAPRGKPCPGDATEINFCNTIACIKNPAWSAWSSWMACSVSCGSGTQSRNRTCLDSTPGNTCQGNMTETNSCSQPACAVDGQWGQWQAWGSCSTTCDTGVKHRHRDCEFNTSFPRGADCQGPNEESLPCSLQFCPVDGVWSQWTSFGACSVTCGPGTSQRTRTCVYSVPIAPKGKTCTGPASEQKSCNSADCPVDGVWQSWGVWEACTASCGGGSQIRRRVCYYPPRVTQGDYCQGRGVSTQECNKDPCPQATTSPP